MLLALTISALGAADLRVKARDDGFLVDSLGRVRIFHGFNDVQYSKGSGYKPGGPDYLPRAMGKCNGRCNRRQAAVSEIRSPPSRSVTRSGSPRLRPLW